MTDPKRQIGTVSLRQGLLLIFFLGSAGLGAELLLLEHFTEWRQQVPLALLGLGLILMVTHLVYKRRVVVRLFRLTMLAFVLGGIVGVWIHFDANMAFELEMYSKLSGWYLITRAAHGALPVLAPGALIQLGLIGLLYAYRHPGLGAGQSEVD